MIQSLRQVRSVSGTPALFVKDNDAGQSAQHRKLMEKEVEMENAEVRSRLGRTAKPVPEGIRSFEDHTRSMARDWYRHQRGRREDFVQGRAELIRGSGILIRVV
jgi:hypothetical protein